MVTETDILITGAGPSGLMMACQLAAGGINFKIIDKKEFPSLCSGAMIIHARSLEILQQLGLAEKFLEEGTIVRAISVFVEGLKVIEFEVKEFGKNISAFPYMLLIEQSKTELLLSEYIENTGYKIERKAELINFVQDRKSILSDIRFKDGANNQIKSRYLVAADGNQSKVRSALSIPFIGKTHKRSLFTIDCKSDINLPHDEICFSFSKSGTAGFFPIPDGRWRIDGILYSFNEREDISFKDIREDFSKKFMINAGIYEPDWFSVFHSHQRYSSLYRKTNCFLVGDSAHLFSPVGAQGMNTGFQDSHNLGWKLSLAIKGIANEKILNSYEAERKPFAKKTSVTTDIIFEIISTKKKFFKKMRNFLLPGLLKLFRLLMKSTRFRNSVFIKISQTGISYNHKSLLNRGPKAGDRLPYILFEEKGKKMNLYKFINTTGFHLFVFSKKTYPDKFIKSLHKYSRVMTIRLIQYTDGTKELFGKLHIKNSEYYLIRPDLHIASKGKLNSINSIENYFNKFMINENQ